jgi:selenide,water dikinase
MKNLVLIGGGHSHAIALRLFGIYPLATDIRLNLITDVANAPYSGMLPGHILGYYSFQECHIDLVNLAKFAQADLIVDRAINLDLAHKQVLCQNHAPIDFDWLSIDIGSTPDSSAIVGVDQYTIAAKPVPQFLTHWQQFLTSLESAQAMPTDRPLRIGIVGGGTGGVELAFTIKSRIEAILQSQGLSPMVLGTQLLEIHLFHRQATLMTGYPANVGKRFEQILLNQGIYVHLSETVNFIKPDSDNQSEQYPLQTPKIIGCESGFTLLCDRIFWLTNAMAPSWIRDSGLTTDQKSFILINNKLQSISHPYIFATGDIASSISRPRPKAGVFAVHQGKPLFKNLQRTSSGQPLLPFYPQKHHLSLIGTGYKIESSEKYLQAMIAWGGLCFGPSKLLWFWKESIDRQFMQQFQG